jgi:hypothetical protein
MAASVRETLFGGDRSAEIPTVGVVPVQRVILVGRSHPLRGDAEACIATVYEQSFCAHVLGYPKTLIALVDGHDRTLCAAGLRTPADGFFSETYLDAPIEQVLSAHSGTPVRRGAVFEVTTLASRNAEVSPLFLRRLTVMGKEAGFEWAFFTATLRLRRLLQGLGIPLWDLAAAEPGRLPDASRWGSYYAHAPRVCAVDGRASTWSDATASERRADA